MNAPDERVIERKLEFDLPIEKVWSALTDPAELASWFSDSADFRAEEGYEGSLTWDAHGSFPMRVERVEAPHRLAWRWSHLADVPLDQDVSTLVEWTLHSTDGGGTVLELRESGFANARRQVENEGGWTSELSHLAAFLDPARGPDFRANTDVAIHVPDLDAAASFYVDGLGLRLLDRSDDHLELDAGAIRLWVNRAPGPKGFIPSFDVRDRAAALARLRGAGATLTGDGAHVYAADPFGNPLDVIQRA